MASPNRPRSLHGAVDGSYASDAARVAPELCGLDCERDSPIPVRYPGVWKMYMDTMRSIWSPGEIDHSADLADYEALTAPEREALDMALSFFAGAERYVGDNLEKFLIRCVTMNEAKHFYTFQAAVEHLHAIVYGNLIDAYTQHDSTKRARLLAGVTRIASVRKKAAWALQWTDPGVGFADNLVAFAFVEGVMFATSFALIYWFKKQGVLPALGQANELIARDETKHALFACRMFRDFVVEKPSVAHVHEIARAAVQHEHAFVRDMLPGGGFVGLSEEAMCRYAEYVCDFWLACMGVPAIWAHEECPLPFMDLISAEGYTNFFERRPTEYHKGSAAGATLDFGAAPE